MARASALPRNAAIRLVVVTAVIATLLAGGIVGGAMYFTLAGGEQAGPGGPGGPGGEAGGPPEGPPPAKVALAAAERREVRQRFEVVGRLREIKRATVAAEVDGKVLAMPVDEGDVVIGGETELARIDPVWTELDVAARQADVAAARATADQARRDYQQLQELLRANSARPKEVEDAQAQLESAEASLAAAKAALSRAREALQRVTVHAPFDGVITRKMVEVGEWVQQGDGVVELISKGEIEAYLDVPERVINQVQSGQTVYVLVDPLGVNIQGEVVAVNPSGANRARTFPVKVRLSDHDGQLKPGMSVTAQIPLAASSTRLTVPRDAVMFTPTGATVWLAAPAEGEGMPTALPANVDVIHGEDDRFVVEVAGGPGAELLAQGGQVVVQGAENLMPSQPLIPAGPAAEPIPADASNAGGSPAAQG